MKRMKGLDDLMEAVAFAEAGETETAQRLASEIFPEPGGPRARRILAVSGAPGFSLALVDDAVGMAERLCYGLVALSAPSPSMARLVAGFRGGRARGQALLSAEAFGARAAERGIPFVHALRRGDPEQAVAEARQRFRRIAFLLLEPHLVPRARFAALGIPIFYVGS